MRGLFRSPALQWSVIFLILSVLAAQQGQLLWERYLQATQRLGEARARSLSLENELARLSRLVASVPQADGAAAPMHERLAVLVQTLRKSEPETRVVIQVLASDGANSADKRAVTTLMQPLPAFPEAGSLGVVVEGSYLTRSGLEAFLAAGRSAGASLHSIAVQERRFQAGFKLYGRF